MRNYELNSGNKRKKIVFAYQLAQNQSFNVTVHAACPWLVKRFEQGNRKLNKSKDITVCMGLYLFHRPWKVWEWIFSDQSTGRGRWIWCQSDLLKVICLYFWVDRNIQFSLLAFQEKCFVILGRKFTLKRLWKNRNYRNSWTRILEKNVSSVFYIMHICRLSC